MCRKFSESAKIWLRHITWLLTKDRADAARKVLDKSFAALPQRKHIKVRPDQLTGSSGGCIISNCSRHNVVPCSFILATVFKLQTG